MLDFPQRKVWEDLAVAYGLPPPPRLLLETAEALNRAYAEEQPLESLLKQHRLLALRRAPLGDRLSILRQVAAADSLNPVWATDIADFEKVRHKQIRAELDQALNDNNMDRLFRLYDEVQSTPWREGPPTALLHDLAEKVNLRKSLRVRRQMEDLAIELARSYAGKDEARARGLRDHWNQLAREADLASEDPLWLRAGPALKWLARNDRDQSREFGFLAALDELERALNRGAEVDELERLWNAALQFKKDVPEELERRYERQVEGLSRASSRREILILSLVCGFGVLLLGAVILFLIFRP
jgi:hypothetical protein